MEVNCENCKEIFSEKDLTLKTENQSAGIEQIYYNCPSCGQRYNVALTSIKTRRLQEEIKNKALLIKSKISKGINNVKDAKQLNEFIKKHKELMDKLNSK